MVWKITDTSQYGPCVQDFLIRNKKMVFFLSFGSFIPF